MLVIQQWDTFIYFITFKWLEDSLCGAQIPQKVPGYIQNSIRKYACYMQKYLKIYFLGIY